MNAALAAVAEHIDAARQADPDYGRLRAAPVDRALVPIAERVLAGQRLSAADALALFRSHDLLGIGALADWANRQKNGDRVFVCANQHLNPTNVCILRATCTFCSFARTPKEDGAYTMSLDEAFHEASLARDTPVREFHIVGGLHPKLRLSYYEDLIRGLKERHPGVEIKALTAVEIAHLARIEKTSVEAVLIRLREAGLQTMPGGGAEVFAQGVRATIAQRKLAADEWLDVHRRAHGLGIPTNCTMLYGHVETLEDRVAHLDMLRTLQDETGGFLAYIPLAYHPDNNELGAELGRTGTATTGFDDLKNLAIGRLFLDNIPHIKTHWIMNTAMVSQVALHFGVDDLEGTVRRERIYHEAGAHTPEGMTFNDILRLVRAAGKRPVERNVYYEEVRSW
ncbi:MAG TPA: aminofutalosine synthase MqnE [Longimicrobiales bacterium]|nr:aminofutalosine synthase MqnE [Longimicrobiales bacterium]